MIQVLVGAGALLLLVLVMFALWLGPRLPGLPGEFFASVAGLVTTPFLMEASFLGFGLLVVFALNHWRRKREGDEFVYLEQAEGPGSEKLPAAARSVVYREAPEEPEQPDPLSRAEGALAIGDCDEAARLLAETDADILASPRGRSLRIALARATGREDLARRLERDDH